MRAAQSRTRGRLHACHRVTPPSIRCPLPSWPNTSCSRPTSTCSPHQHAQRSLGISRLRTASAGSDARSAAASAEAAPVPEVDEDGLTPEQRALNDFLVWLVSNGVQGIGTEDAPVALYQSEDGERGLVAMQAIKKGDVVFRVPLRLALTDHPGDEESNRLMYKGAPWSVRLAAKLLRERGRGPQSPWYPYLSVLPVKVPAPLETFSWEDMQQVEWPPAQAAIYDYNWLVTDAWNSSAGALSQSPQAQLEAVEQLLASGDSSSAEESEPVSRSASPSPDVAATQRVLGGATAEEFQWAMAVVHSRTFANAAKGGGVGVRMLVPLVDMLNHAGDVTASGRMDDTSVRATDNVRWDVTSPERSPLQCWEMTVSATSDIPEGAPLSLSYGERSSDDFFVHYGFVPPLCNPHEDAVLFEDAEEALEWHHTHYAAGMPQEEAEQLYTAAYNAALQEQRKAAQPALAQQQQQQQQQEGSQSPGTADTSNLPKGWQKLKVYAAGRVDGALITAFSTVSGGDTRTAELGVARRARDLLNNMPSALLSDLYLLHQDASLRGDQEEVQTVGVLLMQQSQQQQKVEEQEDLQQGGGTGQTASSPGGDGMSATRHFRCPRDAKTLDGLVQALEKQAQELQQSQVATAGGAAGVLHAPLTPQQLLCVRYRAAKKIVLWGVVYRAVCGGGQSAGQVSQEGQGLLANLQRRNKLGP